MCAWIGHLRIAESLLARLPGLGAAQFAIGNVAPCIYFSPPQKWIASPRRLLPPFRCLVISR